MLALDPKKVRQRWIFTLVTDRDIFDKRILDF